MGDLTATNPTAALVDDTPSTSWASASSTLGYLHVDLPTVTATSLTLKVAFGQGQGPTSVYARALNGDNGAWKTVAATTPVSW